MITSRRRRRLLSVTALVLIVAATASSAQAAATGLVWAPPSAVSGVTTDPVSAGDPVGNVVSVTAEFPQVDIGYVTAAGASTFRRFKAPPGDAYGCENAAAAGDGAAVATWERVQDPNGNATLLASVRLPGTDSWSSPFAVATPRENYGGWCGDEQVGIAPNGAVSIVWTACPGVPTPCTLEVSERSTSGTWSQPVTVATLASVAAPPGLAVTSDGTTVVVWAQQPKPNARSSILTVSQPAGGSWSQPLTLTTMPAKDGVPSSKLTTDTAGDALAVSWTGTKAWTSVRSSSGSWSPVQAAFPAGTGLTTTPEIALSASGLGVVLYGDEEQNGDRTVNVLQSVGGGAWSAPHILESTSIPTDNQIDLQASLDAAGDSVATWTGEDRHTGGSYARVAVHPSGGSWTKSTVPVSPYHPTVEDDDSFAEFEPGGAIRVVYDMDWQNDQGWTGDVVFTTSWNGVQPGGVTAPVPIYLALGDSVAAGEGLEKTTDDPYPDPCHRSTLAYPALLADDSLLSDSPYDFADFACTGASTQNMTDTPQTVNGATVPPQLSQVQALGVPVGAVTITGGIDDLGWVDLLTGCMTYGYSTCSSYTQDVQDEISTMQANLTTLIQDVEALPGSPRVVVTGYYDPFPTNYDTGTLTKPPLGSGTCGLPTATLLAARHADDTILLIEQWLTLLNSTIEQTAQANGATYVDLQSLFTTPDDHGICTGGAWVFPFSTLQKTKVSAFHPKAPGQQAIAARIESSLN